MKVRYSKDQDILMIQLSNKKVDDSYESESAIVHTSADGDPVLLEIFGANKLLKMASKALPQKVRQEVFAA